jgi:hypothetical protein
VLRKMNERNEDPVSVPQPPKERGNDR